MAPEGKYFTDSRFGKGVLTQQIAKIKQWIEDSQSITGYSADYFPISRSRLARLTNSPRGFHICLSLFLFFNWECRDFDVVLPGVHEGFCASL